ncbi:hypothetical protein REIS_0280 [Rickettsia endosymbiont of Ixodes scapularis]|nr:hypothetical protein REIS_0280 [Rickettsia endosymbiont of Ixodes scapularis]
MSYKATMFRQYSLLNFFLLDSIKESTNDMLYLFLDFTNA